MYCTHCGRRIPEDSRKCPLCGADLRYENNVMRNRPAKKKEKQSRKTAGIILSLIIVLAALECAWVFVLSPGKLEKKTTDSYSAAAANAARAASDKEATLTETPSSSPVTAASKEASAPKAASETAPAQAAKSAPTSAPKAEPTPTPKATPTPTPKATPTPTPKATPTPTPKATPEPTPKPTPEPTPKPTPEPTPEPTRAPEPEPEWNEEETWINTEETGGYADEPITKSNSYILPSDSEVIGASDLGALSSSDIRIARNEIFARHGLIFESEDLNAYFNNQAWYHGTTHDPDSIELSGVEQANLDTILEYEGSGGQIKASSKKDPEPEPAPDDTDVSMSNVYILPDSAKKELNESDLDKLSEVDIRIARNELFARHGLIFKSEDLNLYFTNQAWYKGTVKDQDSIRLNSIEQKNLDFIIRYEEEHGLNQS